MCNCSSVRYCEFPNNSMMRNGKPRTAPRPKHWAPKAAGGAAAQLLRRRQFSLWPQSRPVVRACGVISTHTRAPTTRRLTHTSRRSARISGTVIDVYVEDNQKVTAGALIAKIDPRYFQVALDRARATLAQAQAEVKVIAQQQLSAAAQVQGYEATKERAERDWNGFGVLYRGKIIAPQSYDRLVEDARVAASSVAAARAMDSATENSMASVRAAVEAAKAGVAEAELNLSYTKILAPVSGIIGKRTVEVGQRVVPGQQMLALVETDSTWITADYMETQTGPMHPGLPVQIYVDALRKNFEGVVESIAGASGDKYSLLPPENATGNYVKVVQRIPVRIGLKRGQQDAGELRPGMSVEATVWLQ